MRIIQDSDDESEDDIEIIVPAPKENDASGKTKCNDSSNDTGSTGKSQKGLGGYSPSYLHRIVEAGHSGGASQPPPVTD